MNHHLLGFDIGGTNCAVVLGWMKGDLISTVEKLAFPSLPGPEATLLALEKHRCRLLAKQQVDVKAMGISCATAL